MNGFTFAVVAYNQERVIIECLESIKYQIEKYRTNEKCFFILADDCSKDNTVTVVRTWIEQNSSLFENAKYYVASENSGIVANHISAYRHIETEGYRTVSGDDILSDTNVFKLPLYDHKMLIAPVFSIEDGTLQMRELHKHRFVKALKNKERLRDYYRKEMTYCFPVSSIGVAFSRDCIDEGFFNSLSRFRWLEDVAIFDYLIGREDINIEIIDTPLNLYRDTIGISKNKKNDNYDRLREDFAVLRNEIYSSNRRYGLKFNLMRVFLWVRRKIDLALFRFDKKTQREWSIILSQIPLMEQYYKEIKRRSDKWIRNNQGLFSS